jgi:hypothetical protein
MEDLSPMIEFASRIVDVVPLSAQSLGRIETLSLAA